MKIFAVIIVLISTLSMCLAQKESEQPPASLAEMTMHIIPQAHIDLAWWWRYNPETLHIIVKHTLETAFENMEKYPDYTFTYLQVPAIEPLEELYPELFYKLRYYTHRKEALGNRIRNPGASGSEGRLAIGSGLWCEIDGCLPCGESLVRQCLYGKRFFEKQFGIDVKTAWFQDAWTHPWTYPQILKKSGIDSYMFSRPRGEGEQMFWWQSPDGSQVFAYKPFKIDGESLPPQQEIDSRLMDMNRQYGVIDDIILTGVGNHGGGAIKADVERMKNIMAKRDSRPSKNNLPPKLMFSTPSRFVKAVMNKAHTFPVVNDELTPSIRGAYTSVGEIKKGNRDCENLLITLEKFSSIAFKLGVAKYPETCIFDAWKKVMINQFHDTISGTDIPPSIDDALLRYKEVLETGTEMLEKTLKAIGTRINTEGQGLPLIVFNPLSWQRTDVIETEIELSNPVNNLQVFDNRGNRLATQITHSKKKNAKYQVRFLFITEEIPPLGYKCYWVRSVKDALESGSILKARINEMENEFFNITIDPVSGCLKSVFDKQHKREVLDKLAKANQIQIIEDFGDSEGFLKSPEGVSKYNFWTGLSRETDKDPEIELIENGAVRIVLQVKKKFELARFVQRIKIYPKIHRIDFDLVIDWQGKNKMVKVAFPLDVRSPEATYEIPYGTIERPSKGEEHVAQKWVDISENDYGVSLINDSRYGHDVTENVIRLSVLRSPDKPVKTTDEAGIHRLKYALYPHAGSWQEANVMQRGYEFNNPLIAVVDSVHRGALPPVHSFIEITPKNLILSVLKKAEDSEDLVLRFYETEGKKCTANIIFSEHLPIDAVYKIDLLENAVEDVKSNERGFNAKAGAFSIESFKLIKDVY